MERVSYIITEVDYELGTKANLAGVVGLNKFNYPSI